MRNCVSFSLSQNPQKRNRTDYALPPLTETLALIERCACWPPPIREAVISLWAWETELAPVEFWAIAAALLESQEVAA